MQVDAISWTIFFLTRRDIVVCSPDLDALPSRRYTRISTTADLSSGRLFLTHISGKEVFRPPTYSTNETLSLI